VLPPQEGSPLPELFADGLEQVEDEDRSDSWHNRIFRVAEGDLDAAATMIESSIRVELNKRIVPPIPAKRHLDRSLALQYNLPVSGITPAQPSIAEMETTFGDL